MRIGDVGNAANPARYIAYACTGRFAQQGHRELDQARWRMDAGLKRAPHDIKSSIDGTGAVKGDTAVVHQYIQSTMSGIDRSKRRKNAVFVGHVE